MKVKATDVIVPRWIWLTYFAIVIGGADNWIEAVGGLGMCVVGLVRLNDGSSGVNSSQNEGAP